MRGCRPTKSHSHSASPNPLLHCLVSCHGTGVRSALSRSADRPDGCEFLTGKVACMGCRSDAVCDRPHRACSAVRASSSLS